MLLAFSEKANSTLRGRLDGLTSDELLWEPAPGSWSVRLDSTGSPAFDFALFPPRPPVTTIAWRLAHVVDLLKEDRCAVQLGLEPEPNAHELWLTTDAVEALAHYDRAYATWLRYLEATDPTVLDVPIEDGRWPDRHSFVLHILFEVIHHGAEIGVLRDLYAARDALDTLDALGAAVLSGDLEAVGHATEAELAALRGAQPELLRTAAASGRWATADLLVDLGFRASDGPSPSALHHAAGLGRAALVRKLVEHGADPTAVDDQLQRTPLEWARTIGARLGGPQASGADWPAVIAYLETLPNAGEADRV